MFRITVLTAVAVLLALFAWISATPNGIGADTDTAQRIPGSTSGETPEGQVHEAIVRGNSPTEAARIDVTARPGETATVVSNASDDATLKPPSPSARPSALPATLSTGTGPDARGKGLTSALSIPAERTDAEGSVSASLPALATPRVYLEETVPPCTLVTVPGKDPCEERYVRLIESPEWLQVVATIPAFTHARFLDEYDIHPWIEFRDPDYVRSYFWTTHIAVRATGLPGTARCSHGTASHHTHRIPAKYQYSDEEAPLGTARMSCYVDFAIQEYIVGTGAPTLTILMVEHQVEASGFKELESFVLPQLKDLFVGSEWALYLKPPTSTAFEGFETIWEMDIQKSDDGTHYDCEGAAICAYALDPSYPTPLDVLLPDTRHRHYRLLMKNRGRVRPEPEFADIVLDTYDIVKFFRQVGAYTHPYSTPGLPPPLSGDDGRPSAPSGLSDSKSDHDAAARHRRSGSVGIDSSANGSLALTWDPVPGAVKYRIDFYEIRGRHKWLIYRDDIAEASHVVTGLNCDFNHYFRVSAYGDGSTLDASWGAPSDSLLVLADDLTCDSPPG